ncbi:MAG: hypothetical protein U0790_02940 [Isosphaeraceae bacterium]
MSQKPRRRPPGGRREAAGPETELGQGEAAGPDRPAHGVNGGIHADDLAPVREAATGSWPRWAVGLVSCLLLYHMAAVVSGALGVPPSSLLERHVADLFTPYHDLVDQGYAYRYYAEPPPTPVITARLRFGDGRPEQVVRIPDRSLAGPRMRHQRQLALANALFMELQQSREPGAAGRGNRLGAAYARKLCAGHPGCASVTLHAQQHLIPDPEHVREHRETSPARAFDLFDESLFTTPQWIGDFPCDGS